MFVWVFHRVSGVLLIFLLAIQLSTGVFQGSRSGSQLVATSAELHKHAALNCLLAFLVIFHALYGVRTILLDLGAKREKLLFWACTILGVLVYAAFLTLFFAFAKA